MNFVHGGAMISIRQCKMEEPGHLKPSWRTQSIWAKIMLWTHKYG